MVKASVYMMLFMGNSPTELFMPAYLGHASYKADRGKIAYGLLERFMVRLRQKTGRQEDKGR